MAFCHNHRSHLHRNVLCVHYGDGGILGRDDCRRA